jgi:hypothetical protein
MKPVSGGCVKRENPGGQPPTPVSYEATEGNEATEGTEFTEFVFSTGIFRMYRIGRGQGNGTAKAPEDMADIHRAGNIWREFILGILYIDVQNIFWPTLISLTCTPLKKWVSSWFPCVFACFFKTIRIQIPWDGFANESLFGDTAAPILRSAFEGVIEGSTAPLASVVFFTARGCLGRSGGPESFFRNSGCHNVIGRTREWSKEGSENEPLPTSDLPG